MYSIKTKDFILDFTPGVDSILIEVHCYGFSGLSCFDAEDFLIADFALQLKDMYEKLEGVAKIQDLYETDSYIEFAAQKTGHVLIKGIIINGKCKHTQQLTFEYDVDQTYLKKFVSELVTDYSKYVE